MFALTINDVRRHAFQITEVSLKLTEKGIRSTQTQA
jgi:hypothetical protein